jgi:hypothetical protein
LALTLFYLWESHLPVNSFSVELMVLVVDALTRSEVLNTSVLDFGPGLLHLGLLVEVLVLSSVHFNDFLDVLGEQGVVESVKILALERNSIQVI